MTSKKFLNSLARGKKDILEVFLDILAQSGRKYCLIGGMAVNAYAEPVVSLDLGIVIAAGRLAAVLEAAAKHGFKAKRFETSVNLTRPDSDLRIQIQTDDRYQDFIPSAVTKNILGYRMKVAAVEDVLKGKIWAFSDEKRRMSKRHKDAADIMRLIETYPRLKGKMPAVLRKKI